jgi:glyoxylase-like metal-dependent hydrolase (beta-lactamase superfamily II)
MKRSYARLATSANWFSVASDVWGIKDIMVNMYMIYSPSTQDWFLIDTGLKWSAPKIRKMADDLFWPDTRPAAIILTHGHFDHVGSVAALADEWRVPVYSHIMEVPYLTDLSSYPPPDPNAGGGLFTAISWMFPNKAINIAEHIRPLPEDGSIPGLPEWKYIFTPGHSPGHISLYRESDGVLLAGDAFVTTQQESFISVLTQKEKLKGPPRYFTCDWQKAADSVNKLADLEPEVVATGHGKPMYGEAMRESLHQLADNFTEMAVPAHGRYSKVAAEADEGGVTYIPPAKKRVPIPYVVAGIAALAVISWIAFRRGKKASLPPITAEGLTKEVKEALSI